MPKGEVVSRSDPSKRYKVTFDMRVVQETKREPVTGTVAGGKRYIL